MERLLLTFGLVIAFFVLPVKASIYDNVSFDAPKIETVSKFQLKRSFTVYGEYNSADDALAASPEYYKQSSDYKSLPGERGEPDCHWHREGSLSITCQATSVSNGNTYGKLSEYYFNVAALPPVETRSCPPDSNLSYLYDVDTNGDGKIDKCYNPLELDNASNCQNQVGSMLPALTNISNRVCKTDSNTGASCGYSRSEGDNSFQLDLEMNCFGDDKEVPDYNDEPMPEPDTCSKMNDQLMVCKFNPDEKCDFYGRCEKDCGYVNGQFYCFKSCTGTQCDEQTPPEVDCIKNPSDPSCPIVEPEVPENCTKSGAGLLCKENPDEKCDADGVCEKGCGEVNGVFVCYKSPSEGSELLDIDLKPLVDELKALNKKFDFTTKIQDSTKDLGKLGSVFSDEDVNQIKEKVVTTKEEIKTTISSIKTELTSMFNVTSSGGAYVPPSIKTTFGDFTSNIWTLFSEYVHIIASAVMFIAYLIAARVVLE